MEDNKQATEPVIPQDAQTPTVDYTYQDLQSQSVRDIAENKEIPKAPIEEKKIETPEEEIPLEEVGKKIAEETANAIYEKQKAEAQATEEARVAAEKAAIPVKTPNEEYQQIVKDFQTEKNRLPTWEELAVKIEDRTLAKLEASQAERAKAADEAQKQVVAKQEADAKILNTVIDDELNDLYNSGRLTKIKDANNPSDQGVIERKALFQTWADVNNDRRTKGLPDIVSATRIHEFYYKKPNAQPAGAAAPVQGNKGSATPPSTEQNYSYQDLKKPWSWFKNKP